MSSKRGNDNPQDQLERTLDDLVDSIRDDVPNDAALDAAADRAWNGIAAAAGASADGQALRGCDDYIRVIPDYLAGRLSGARKMLVADHLGECVTCRRELRRLRSGTRRPVAAIATPTRPWFRRTAGQLAAAAAIVIAVLGLSVQTDVFSIESHGLIKIEAIDGELLKVGDDGVQPLSAGDVIQLGDGEQIRTAKGSSASIRLADDSQVELNERTELAVFERRPMIPLRRTDGRIALERGSIIVEASDQGSGHLYVDTADCNVAVKGTVFAVNHGMKGSRVSVIEGEVQVDYGRQRDTLAPGDQSTTSDALARVPVEDEIAWSRNLERHIALLREMKAIGREMDRALRPESRYDSARLDLTPAGTAIYIAAPNLSSGLADAYSILIDRIGANQALAEWWSAANADGEMREHLDLVVDRVREYGDHLGEELVLTMQLDPAGEPTAPLIVAPLTDAAGLRALIERETGELADDVQLFVGDALPISGFHGRSLYIWLRDDLVAVTPDLDRLHALSAVIGGTRGTALEGGFRDRLAARYDRGVEWLVGVDLGAILDSPMRDEEASAPLEQLGLSEARHLIAERTQHDDRAEHRADLYFDGPRRNIAAWLGEPAPMGGLEYVSPDAHVVGGFVMKEMGVVVGEMLEFVADNNDGFEGELAAFEQEHGIDVRADLAEPLGGEFVFTLDGSLLPTPAWTLVAEIYDPTRFDRSIEWLVEKANEAATEAGHDFGGVSFSVEQVGGRSIRRVQSESTSFGVSYTVDNGYLVAGPSQTVVERALRVRDSGLSLVDAPRFAELMPRGDEIDFSAVLYQNLGPVLGSVMGTLGATGASLPPEQQQLAQALASESEPSLALVYGGRDRISVVGVSEGGLFSSGLGSMISLPSFMGVQESLMQAHAHQAAANDGGS